MTRFRLENLALRIHSSFLRAEICRPYLAIMSNNGENSDDESTWLHNTCTQSMEDVVKAYLEMAKMSILPMRSWSLIHEALTCSCVLALLQSTLNDSLVDGSLDKMRQLLEGELQPGVSESRLGTVGFISRGVRLLTFLREHGAEIMQAGTISQQATVNRSHMISSVAEQTHAAAESDFRSQDSTTLSEAPGMAADSGVDQMWWEPFLMDIGLDNSLSSFLDVSSDFLK